jgi:hypothetical protein
MRIGVTGHQELGARRDELDTAIREYLAKTDSLVGISSLAVGADQLFAKAVLDVGGLLNVVVPSAQYISTFTSDAEQERYVELLGRASSVEQLSFEEPSELAFLEAGRAVVRRSDCILALWDGQEAAGLGGTADVVAYAKARGTPVVILW